MREIQKRGLCDERNSKNIDKKEANPQKESVGRPVVRRIKGGFVYPK